MSFRGPDWGDSLHSGNHQETQMASLRKLTRTVELTYLLLICLLHTYCALIVFDLDTLAWLKRKEHEGNQLTCIFLPPRSTQKINVKPCSCYFVSRALEFQADIECLRSLCPASKSLLGSKAFANSRI